MTSFTEVKNVCIIETGVANIASVRGAIRKLGGNTLSPTGPDSVLSAPYVLLPGVGAFGAAMSFLHTQGFVDPLVERINRGLPTLCICLGFQLLFEESEESPGVTGLAVMSGVVKKYSESAVRVPHFGWNLVTPALDFNLVNEGYAYFANSYRVTSIPPEWSHCVTDYQGEFVSAARRRSVVGAQFHPELSGAWGMNFLRSFLELS